MKALVLCGGLPQAALIRELKGRNIFTILADINENVEARKFSDKFYKVSALDMEGIAKIAIKEQIDLVLTVCADQVLLVQAKISEQLGLPCYIDYETAKKVSNKELMKKFLNENDIPTSKYVIVNQYSLDSIKEMSYPMVVKPTDSYSSRSVRKVFEKADLESAVNRALRTSSAKTAVVEEYVQGEELTVDAYIQGGIVYILSISHIDKIPSQNQFVICRTRYPALIGEATQAKIVDIANKIATGLGLKDSPLLIQLVVNEERISVIEFCARTGGGDKFRLIQKVSGVDVIRAMVDLSLGIRSKMVVDQYPGFIVNEFIYTKDGVLDYLQGFEEMKQRGLIAEYYQLKEQGRKCGGDSSSGDRVAYYTVEAQSVDALKTIDQKVNDNVKIIDMNGEDIMLHDFVASF